MFQQLEDELDWLENQQGGSAMQRELRLYDAGERASEPDRPRVRVPRLAPHYALVVLPLKRSGDPEEIKRYPNCHAAVTDLDALARDPERLAKLHRVEDAAWIAVIDSTDFEVRRHAILRLVRSEPVQVSWWWKILRRWWR